MSGTTVSLRYCTLASYYLVAVSRSNREVARQYSGHDLSR